MSKTPLTYSSENILRCTSASNNQAYLRRPSKDTKAAGFKSPLKSSTTNKIAPNSPVQYLSKTGYAWMHLKSPTEKAANHIIPSVDNYDSKENCSFETKILLSSKPENKKGYLALNIDKSLSTYNKLGSSSQLKSPQMTSLNLAERDVRSPLLAEPPKKASLPTNLKLTLEKICTKGGSSTHRAHLSSPTSEHANKLLGGAEAHRKSGRISGVGVDSKTKGSQDGNNRTPSNSNAKCKLSTLLIGLSQPSSSKNKKPGKLSLRDVHSVNVTPRQDYNEVYSIEEKTDAIKKYNKLLLVLKEKNSEIKRLSQDKSQLESTLGTVVEELKVLRHNQGASKERAASLVDPKDNTGSTGSTGQRSEDSKTSSQNPSFITNMHQYAKSGSLGNRDNNKTTKGLNSSNGASKNVKGLSDRSGKNWATAVTGKEVASRSNGAKSGMQEKSAEQKYQVYEDEEYLKEIDEQFEQQKASSNKVYISSFGRDKTRQQVEKKEREATSVDDGVLRRRASYGVDLDKRKASLQEGLDIGGALSELKGRIEKLLQNKNKEDGEKTKRFYKNLQEQLQKVA